MRLLLLSFITFLIINTGTITAQSMTGTIIAQPCNNDGQIGVTVTGLTPPISYSYTNYAGGYTQIIHNNINSTSDIVSGLPGTSFPWGTSNEWTVSASDGLNTASQTFTLTPAFTYSISGTNAVCPAMGTVQATVSGGTFPHSFQWTNLQSLQVYTANPAVVADGSYSLVVTDAAGCIVASPGFSTGIFVYTSSPVSITFSGTIANCTNGTAIATASDGVAPYTYLWNNGAITPSIGGLTQGVYYCMATDAQGCKSYNSAYTVAQSVNLTYNSSVTNATCIQSNGSILSFVSGGTAPYNFLWNNGATTQNISGLGANNYNVQITDANGCIGSGSAYVSSTTPISVTYTASPSSCMSPSGSATVTATGGLAPYTIVWTTYPVNSTGPSISNKPVGTYFFTVTDANGCIRTGSAYIPPASTITAYLYNNTVICPVNTGNLQTYVSGTSAPFTYAWSNGATTSSLTGVSLGTYNCVITDAVGCSVTKFASLSQTSPINVGFSTTQASCVFAADGAIQATAFGGTAPYTYSWSNGQIGSNATGLLTGDYYASVVDANGCPNNYSNSLAHVNYNTTNNSCYCTITGTVYADANINCINDLGENGIENIQIHCSGLGYTYTDVNGIYSFMAPTGSYTVSQSIQQNYPLALCQTNNQAVSVTAISNCSTTVNFANTIVPVHDLHIINTSINQPIPGNVYYQKVIVQNDGTVAENNIQMGYTTDGQLTYTNCTPWALTQQNIGTYPNWYSIASGFPVLISGTSSSSIINYNVPTNIPLNTLINMYDTVAHAAPIASTWLTDNTPWNNVANHQATVIGSFDPNFKEVTPKGSGVQGFITTSDSILTYVVHFQNTGSYFAQNIVVTDTLDSDLNITSLQPGYSDHNYTVTVTENGVIKFNFHNINLAWKSTYGDILSSGMFTYDIKLKNNLTIGTQIKNKAAIYFDYNEPVITNTTLNTIASPTSIKEIKGIETNDAALYPNPANTDFYLTFNTPEKLNGVLSIINISGQVVSIKTIALQQGENNLHENTSHLQSGLYFVQLKTNNEIITKKLVIAK